MKILPTIGPETVKTKNLKFILNKNDCAFLITISFPKKGSTANSISLIKKKDI